MRRAVSTATLAAAFALALALAAPALAAEPPNQDDPCSRAGRNVCGTLGVGSYKTYRYGVRWFGSYRGAVPGETNTYCIDLRYWYPSPAYRFREDVSATLRNRAGKVVPLENRRRMAYAVWNAGRAPGKTEAAAVMLYVHGLMGDAAPGEAAPGAIGPEVAERYARIARDAARYHGPYRLEIVLPRRLESGVQAEGKARVIAANGNAVPGVELRLDAGGGSRAPATVTSNANGVATFALTPGTSDALRLRIRTEALASTLPKVFAPTAAAAARNGQRLVAPDSQVVTETVVREVRTIKVTTVVSATRVEPGATISDTVMIEGLAGRSATIRAELYGPFSSRRAIRCTGTPFWAGSLQASGDGEVVTEPVKVEVPGYYTYRESVTVAGLTRSTETACGEAAETTVVTATPGITTKVSAQRTAPGTSITDTVIVSGLGVLHVTVAVELFGPFDSVRAIRCDGVPFWKGAFVATGDGTYTTAPVRLDRAGYYTYRESIGEGPETAAATTTCGDVAETTLVRVRPSLATVASADVVLPGARLHDSVRVTGLGTTRAVVELELFGPFASRGEIGCDGSPFWKGRFAVPGDGVHRSPAVRVAKAGFYAYRERLVATALVAGRRGACGAVSETSLARPLIVTGGRSATRGSRAAADAGGRAPVSVRVPTLGIDAAITQVKIDVAKGVLGVPSDIRRAAWWVDGAAPGDRHGAILVAGHVDSASRGPGAFFALRTVRAGTRVELRTRDGRTRAYRVVSVRTVRKGLLPAEVYSRRGKPRLVLVTCGGPFDAAIRHYRDNVVVTAVPV